MRKAHHLNGQIRTTAEIVEFNTAKSLHRLPRDLLQQEPVSKTSRWGDSVWSLDHATTGASASVSKIRWDIDLPDGQKLTSSDHSDMLDWVRRLVWSLIAAPSDSGSKLSPGNLGQLSPGIRYLLRWLVANHIVWPIELDQICIGSFLEDIEGQACDESKGEVKPTAAQVYIKLRPLLLLWQQRFVLARAGIAPMPYPPFGRRSANQIANKIARIAIGAYRPLPDEVAIPLLNTSMWMLGEPAEDVISLAHGCVDILNNGKSERPTLHALDLFIRSFQFSNENGQPWHWSLDPHRWNIDRIRDVSQHLERLRSVYIGQQREDDHKRLLDSLPSIVRNRPYVDAKRIFLNLGLDLSWASAVPYIHEWRSIIEDRAQTEELYLSSGNLTHRVRELALAVQSAAHLVIQATTGMRISEIAGMEAGLDEATGLPAAVSLRDSTSGLGELFVLRSNISKGEKTPTSAEWTLGYRLKGSNEIPPAVHAITIVNRLMSPWRSMLGKDHLFLTFSNPIALPKSVNSVSPPQSHRLRDTARDFIEEWVDLTSLPDDAARPTMDGELIAYRESHGRIVKTHQMRKLFANFAYRVDARMLPVLQMHFQHVTTAMTDGGYIMSDPALLREKDDVRHQQAALIALETAKGNATLAGRYGVELEEKIKNDLAGRIEGADAGSSYDEAFAYVEEAALNRLFYEPYGICGTKSPSEMACHVAGGTEEIARWSHQLAPNYQTRVPSLCAGCPSFVVARWHRPYWETRYIDHAVPLALAHAESECNSDIDPYLAVTSFRMRQALALAKKLGADQFDLEGRVDARIKEILDGSKSKPYP